MGQRGRPRLADGEAATACIWLRVTDAQRRDLHDVARENHTTISDMVRQAVLEWVAEQAERRDLRQRTGAASSASSCRRSVTRAPAFHASSIVR